MSISETHSLATMIAKLIRMSLRISVIAVVVNALLSQNAQAANCNPSLFTSQDRKFPDYNGHVQLGSRVYGGNGPVAFWHVYFKYDRVVSLTREYFSDNSSRVYRIIPKSQKVFLIQEEPSDTQEELTDSSKLKAFVICHEEGNISLSIGSLEVNDEEMRRFATALENDFLLLEDVEPYRKLLFEQFPLE